MGQQFAVSLQTTAAAKGRERRGEEERKFELVQICPFFFLFSFISFTSPVVMLMRIPFGVPLWQQGLSLLLLIGIFMFAVWFAAKIYRVGILMYGKKPTYKELFKWLKY